VDTFVHPGTSKLAKTASALSRFSEEATQLGILLGKREAEADVRAGRLAAEEIQGDAKSYEEAIRKGIISPDQSPWFRQGAREQFGRLAADEFGRALQVNLLDPNHPLGSGTNPEDFDNLVNDARADFLAQFEDRDGAFDAGFTAKVDSYIAAAASQFVQSAGGRLIDAAKENTYLEARNAVAQAYMDDADPLEAGAILTRQLDLAHATGLGRVAGDMMRDAIIDYAEEQVDPSILNVMRHIQTGPRDAQKRPSMADTYSKAITAARRRIASQSMQLQNWERQEIERQRVENARQITTDYWSALVEADNPMDVDLAGFQQRMIDNKDPDGAEALVDVRQAIINQTGVPNNPRNVEYLMSEIYLPRDIARVDSQTVMGYVGSQQISRSDAEVLMRHIDRRDSMEGQRDPRQQSANQSYTRALTRIRGRFVSELGIYNPARAEAAAASQAALSVWWETNGERILTSGESVEVALEEESDNIVALLRQRFGNALDLGITDLSGADVAENQRNQWTRIAVVNADQYARIFTEFEAADFDPSLLEASTRTFLTVRGVNVDDPYDIERFLTAQAPFANPTTP
jgi:hypothetical protein